MEANHASYINRRSTKIVDGAWNIIEPDAYGLRQVAVLLTFGLVGG